jgi:hypothetical protein
VVYIAVPFTLRLYVITCSQSALVTVNSSIPLMNSINNNSFLVGDWSNISNGTDFRTEIIIATGVVKNMTLTVKMEDEQNTILFSYFVQVRPTYASKIETSNPNLKTGMYYAFKLTTITSNVFIKVQVDFGDNSLPSDVYNLRDQTITLSKMYVTAGVYLIRVIGVGTNGYLLEPSNLTVYVTGKKVSIQLLNTNFILINRNNTEKALRLAALQI